MMPVRPVRRFTAGGCDFFKCRNQGLGAIEKRINVRICLTLEISHKITEYKAKVDQKNKNNRHAENRCGNGGLIDAGAGHQMVYGFRNDDGIDQQVKCGE